MGPTVVAGLEFLALAGCGTFRARHPFNPAGGIDAKNCALYESGGPEVLEVEEAAARARQRRSFFTAP